MITGSERHGKGRGGKKFLLVKEKKALKGGKLMNSSLTATRAEMQNMRELTLPPRIAPTALVSFWLLTKAGPILLLYNNIIFFPVIPKVDKSIINITSSDVEVVPK